MVHRAAYYKEDGPTALVTNHHAALEFQPEITVRRIDASISC